MKYNSQEDDIKLSGRNYAQHLQLSGVVEVILEEVNTEGSRSLTIKECQKKRRKDVVKTRNK